MFLGLAEVFEFLRMPGEDSMEETLKIAKPISRYVMRMIGSYNYIISNKEMAAVITPGRSSLFFERVWKSI